ncbi:MAG: hypothetical protein GYA86_00955 [Firmicutes bacterium]|nr:hypothetical protein [Bacillota bacterium]
MHRQQCLKPTDELTVTVTVVDSRTDAEKYDAAGGDVTKPYGEPTTADDVAAAITVTDEDGNPHNDYTVEVDPEADLPDGETPGEYEIPAKVIYPDGSEDEVTVTVTVTDRFPDSYSGSSKVVNKPFGEPVTEEEVKNAIAIKDKDGNPYVGEFDIIVDAADLPDGQTSGEYAIPVTIVYPDGQTERIIVIILVGDDALVDPEKPALPQADGGATIPYQLIGLFLIVLAAVAGKKRKREASF